MKLFFDANVIFSGSCEGSGLRLRLLGASLCGKRIFQTTLPLIGIESTEVTEEGNEDETDIYSS